jgi:hypothetical protein
MVISDEAKRVSDEYGLHRVADPHGSIGRWIACRLTDGTSDHVLYDSKSDAVAHQHHDERFYTFIQLGPWPMTPVEAQTRLDVDRRMYDAGLRLADKGAKNGGMDMIRRVSQEDQLAQLRSLFRGSRPTNISYRKG